jgi:predicted  nucleic acid-binding Zn-ribbon protein
MTSKRMKPRCMNCGDTFSAKRARAGYKLCLECGEDQARQDRQHWCVAGINKSNPMLITNLETLKQLNPKRVSA